MSGRLVDQDARDAIRTRLDVTMMVEAAAGTGKTTSLVSRMVALIREGRCTVDTLAAITFTVKAASHLRERFHEKLQRASIESRGEEKRRVDEALAHLERCFIGTTHAFCGRLLRERPVEAGIDPEFRELDETSAAQITQEFYRAYVERESAAGNEHLAALRSAGILAPQLLDAFQTLTGNPDVCVAYEVLEAPDLTPASNHLNALLNEIRPHLPDDSQRDPGRQDGFEILIRRLLQHRAGSVFDSPDDYAELLEVANHRSRKPTQKNWSATKEGKQRAKEFGDRYRELVVATIHPAVDAWRQYVHGLIVQFLSPAVAEFALERRRNGTLTFEDLLLSARDLLRDNPNVRRYFHRRFTHLLVDEFQDTDPLQAEVMLYLTGEEVDEPRWKRLTPRAGSLFVVGDPKQSIYRFRRADITTYLEVRDRIAATGGEILQLSTNFRSFPAICEWSNENFRVMFAGVDVDERRQAAHVDLVPYRAPSQLSGVVRLDVAAENTEGMAEEEAEKIARWIRSAVDAGVLVDDEGGSRPIRWRDVMLVSWTRERLPIYARALERMAIPYEVTGGRSFSFSEELGALRQAVRALVDPEDQVAVAAFLRGPLCGVDDQALYEFARAGGSFRLFVPLPHGVDSRITAAFELLRETVRESVKLPPGALLARFFDRLGMFALAVARPQHETRAGNMLLALAYARGLSSQGESLDGVARHLEMLLAEGSETEEMSVDAARADAVRLMNLHQVKGLEAPVVFLIDPGKSLWRGDPNSYIDRSGDESVAYFSFTFKKGKNTKTLGWPADWEEWQEREKRYRNAEVKRLLYVAGTRAKNMLVLGVSQKKGGGDQGVWTEYVHRPSTALPFFEAHEEAAAEPPQTSDAASARRRIDQAREHSGQLSYSVLPITKLAKGSHAELVKQEEGLGKGTSWGRVMHRLLEAMLRDERVDVRLYAANLLKDEERDAAELDEVLAVVDALTASEIWSRVKAADERLVEVPFAVEVSSAELGLDGPPKTLLHGQIDLVFREGDHWYVVDYKTDATQGRLESLVAYYAPQVEQYTRWWSTLTGAPATGGLLFLDTNHMHWL